ncbi:uncharacterized protein Tco025E_07024 [Trypanosoma conorhini]|uniref:Metaxin glutathione S-transferase domain-containing protein n=1 Tax=Trypanosoma conorhini TaxID=83891 RepID=A0A3R7L7I6_9TRYP|nr:uncharacterized protein Tco025E_07024 [Trypanosoma conorhini]RNF09167.1 hypothetical protein Tco025E_07024 [Trypanosoma conorhini]
MAHDETAEFPTVTLFRYPACFAIPTADPHALAVECMLRFVGAHFVKRDAPLPVALEIPTSSGSPVVRKKGLVSCLQLIEDVLHVDEEVLSVEQRQLLLCVRVLVEKSLLPAFVYITHSDQNLFTHSIRKGVEPKVATLLQRLRGNYRSSVVDGSGCCGRYASMEEALAEVEKGLRALQAFHVSHSKSSGTFFLGTERPCSADALAYAAASSFLHADFAGHHAPATLVELQRRLKEDCPALVTFIEKVRQTYFEDYSAYYTLRATNERGAGDAAARPPSGDELFKKGRWMCVAWTIGFSLLYFTLSNANLILEALSELEPEAEAEAEAEAAEQKSDEA